MADFDDCQASNVGSHARQGWPSPRIVYSPRYNMGFFGVERWHPFDSRKYGRAWRLLRRRFGRELKRFWVQPPRPMNRSELLALHTEAYLRRLRDPGLLAQVLEIPQLRHLPGWVIDWCVLRPMRWATMGTLVAAQQALEYGIAVNLSGGYHHASPDDGHGFCAYADVGLAVQQLRQTRHLGEQDRIIYVDLDAHQGNGVCRTFLDDSRVFIYDQYNHRIFPSDVTARRRIDCDVPVNDGCNEASYLAALRSRLPTFLDSVARTGSVRLGIYNAGTDVYVADQLGGLNLSETGVLERDRFVLQQFMRWKIPTVILLSGGYSRESHQLVAEMVSYVLKTWGLLSGKT